VMSALCQKETYAPHKKINPATDTDAAAFRRKSSDLS